MQLAQIILPSNYIFLFGLLGLHPLQFLAGFAAVPPFNVNSNDFETSHELHSSCRRKMFLCPSNLQFYYIALVLNVPSYHHARG